MIWIHRQDLSEDVLERSRRFVVCKISMQIYLFVYFSLKIVTSRCKIIDAVAGNKSYRFLTLPTDCASQVVARETSKTRAGLPLRVFTVFYYRLYDKSLPTLDFVSKFKIIAKMIDQGNAKRIESLYNIYI